MIKVLKPLPWPDAMAFCKGLGAKAMVPETQEESGALIKVIEPYMKESGRQGNVNGMFILDALFHYDNQRYVLDINYGRPFLSKSNIL